MRVSAIVAAAGQGKRMGDTINKQYLAINGRKILTITLLQLDQIIEITELIVVVPASDLTYCEKEIFQKTEFKTPYKLIPGGKERQDSVYAGLAALSNESDYVLIHDGARPLITIELIENVLKEAVTHGTAVLAVPVKDTIKVVNSNGFVESTPDRARLRAVQTPQVFCREQILQAYHQAQAIGYVGTDDASLLEAMGQSVFLVPGSYENIKITTPEDLLLAEEILRRRAKCG